MVRFENELFDAYIFPITLKVIYDSFLRLYGKEYAVKIIDKSKWKGEYQIIENEVEILRKVNHPNIIKLLDEYDMPSELYLVMELEVNNSNESVMRFYIFS